MDSLRSEYEYADSYRDLLQQAIFTNALHGSEYIHTPEMYPHPLVTHWNGLDLEDTYLKNLNNHFKRKQLIRWGWIDSNIEYHLNSWGFRSQREFSTVTDPSLVVMGCSFTFGTGLHQNQLWGELLADSLGLQLINLGTPGHGLSLSTQWLLLEGNTQIINPRAIVIYVPPPGRISWVESAHGYAIGNTYMMTGFDTYPRVINHIAVNAFMDYVKNYNTICLWAQSRSIPVHVFTEVQGNVEVFGLARDLQHHGAGWHHMAAKLMYKQVQANKNA